MTPSLIALFFLSGWTALVYEVLWMRQCGILFGNAAQAAAMSLAVFFVGLAAGSRVFGTRAVRSPNPLRLYAVLEAAVAASAVGTLSLIGSFHSIYAALAPALAATPAAVTALKIAVAIALLAPTAVLLGGTLPAMAQHLIDEQSATARIGSLLYGVNTLGGAFGALAAGFLLPPTLGFTRTCILAAAANAAIASVALILSRSKRGARPAPATGSALQTSAWREMTAIAAVSGFASVALEVLWTLMFSQVLHNSVYSFSILLVTFLLALAGGGLLAHRLSGALGQPEVLVSILATSAGFAVGLTPFVFNGLTHGLHYLAPAAGWFEYLANVAGLAAAVMLVPGILMGTIFPSLFRAAQHSSYLPGELIGRLTAANTAGAVAGSLTAGFVAVPWLGLWGSIRAVAVVYLLLAIVVARSAAPVMRPWTLFAPLVGLLLLVTAIDPTHLPQVLVDRERGETLLHVAESGAGVVAVVERDRNRYIKVDNYYSLGGVASRRYEEAQADLPILIHPRPRTVFFLGVGTGITAGASLSHPIEQVTAVELLADVVTAARDYFGEYVNGLFKNPRATVVVADGRQYLLSHAQRYDVIVGDLFIPWHAGESGLYTREQFEIARGRLAPGGLFAQWLPLYQLSKEETFVIIRTMLSVFPQVTLWRGDFLPHRPIIAIVGEDRSALDADAVVEGVGARRGVASIERDTALGLMGLFYAGNLSLNAPMFDDYEINTDDRPIIEYRAPIAQRRERAGSATFFTSSALLAWYQELFEATPPETDPYLTELTAPERGFVRAGLALFEAGVHDKAGHVEEARRAAESFRALAPHEIEELYARQLKKFED